MMANIGSRNLRRRDIDDMDDECLRLSLEMPWASCCLPSIAGTTPRILRFRLPRPTSLQMCVSSLLASQDAPVGWGVSSVDQTSRS